MQRKFSIHTMMNLSKCKFLRWRKRNFSFNFRMTIFYFLNYRDRAFPNIEVSGMSISQSIDAPITTRDTVSMSGSMSSQNGNAQGQFIESILATSCNFFNVFNHFLSFAISGGFLICGRRLVNQGWFEFVAGAGNGPLIGVKGSRNLTNKVFCNGDFTLNFRKNGIIPGIVGSMFHFT